MADARVSVLLDIQSRLGGLDKAMGGFKELAGTVRRVRRRLPSTRTVPNGVRAIIGPGAEVPRKKVENSACYYSQNRHSVFMTKKLDNLTGAHGLVSAPLQFKGEFHFEASREVLWPVLTDAKEIAKWFPIVSRGKFDHRESAVPQACGVGSKRFCQTIGMGILDETIHFWDPPRQVGYEVRNMMMPIKDHLSIMTLNDDQSGGTQFVWEQYFSYKGLVMRHVFPTMMLTMMNRGMEILRKRYGGRGGKMQRVSLGKLA